jgi:hypothetical protein
LISQVAKLLEKEVRGLRPGWKVTGFIAGQEQIAVEFAQFAVRLPGVVGGSELSDPAARTDCLRFLLEPL